VVSFHGGLSTDAPAKPGTVRAAILVCTGAVDPFVSREHRSAFEDEMVAAGADWQLQVYAHAMHGFTERGLGDGKPPRAGSQYHQATDRRSWRAMRAFLDEAFDERYAPRG
jgi:dienelactone hydrolase